MLAIILTVTFGLDSNEVVDATQLAKLIQGLHAPYLDYEALCEGTYRVVDMNDPDREGKAKRIDRDDQANFAYRADGATYFEKYSRPPDPDALPARVVRVLLRGKLTTDARSPEQQRRKQTWMLSVERGGPGSLAIEGSPERFVYLWFWRMLLREPSRWKVLLSRWDNIDGQACLYLEIDPYPESNLPEPHVSKVWLDVDRGGHVLRHEEYMGGKLVTRTRDIELRRFEALDGTRMWFPVRGVYESFLNGNRYEATPVVREVSYLVNGTLRLNQRLPDSRFDVAWSGKVSGTPGFEAARAYANRKAGTGEPRSAATRSRRRPRVARGKVG